MNKWSGSEKIIQTMKQHFSINKSVSSSSSESSAFLRVSFCALRILLHILMVLFIRLLLVSEFGRHAIAYLFGFYEKMYGSCRTSGEFLFFVSDKNLRQSYQNNVHIWEILFAIVNELIGEIPDLFEAISFAQSWRFHAKWMPHVWCNNILLLAASQSL